jgi:GNAT superfamily N-acetyltransferase
MKIEHPHSEQIPSLRALWKEAFGDTDNFLDKFFGTAFSPKRCLCATVGCELAAMAYWFCCEEYAYIYAVATARKYRGKGICHALMEQLHTVLEAEGYAGCIVLPGEESLRDFYRGMGYENFGGVHEFNCEAGTPLPLRKLDKIEFAALRRNYLPTGGVIQERENLDFLSCWASYYEGPRALITAIWEDGELKVMELLGDEKAAPSIVAALGAKSGSFRSPGSTPYAMHRPLCQKRVPKYFAFCF